MRLVSDDKGKGFDFVSLGRAMEAIPPAAWAALVAAATETFRELARPITATCGGLGRWLEQKFANKVEVEKVLLADALKKAKEKIDTGFRTVAASQNLATLTQLVDSSSRVDEALPREMWINLLARELSGEGIHPEFVSILNRLTSDDAHLLISIAENSQAAKQRLQAQRLMDSMRRSAMGGASNGLSEGLVQRYLKGQTKQFDLSETLLQTLNLIHVENRMRYLTEFGQLFLDAVSDPSAGSTRTAPLPESRSENGNQPQSSPFG